jgi:hypothetical protein
MMAPQEEAALNTGVALNPLDSLSEAPNTKQAETVSSCPKLPPVPATSSTANGLQSTAKGTDPDDVDAGTLGFSFSPGGLLFPYHLGVLSILVEHGYVTDKTPLVGSSAGAIAIAAYGAGISFKEALQCCTRITQKCHETENGGARGRLLKFLEDEMWYVMPESVHETLNERPGMIGLAYREIFPRNRAVLQSHFDNKEDVVEAVCNSSMFPFFTTNKPFAVRPSFREKKEKPTRSILTLTSSTSSPTVKVTDLQIDEYLPSASNASSICSESSIDIDADTQDLNVDVSQVSPSGVNDTATVEAVGKIAEATHTNTNPQPALTAPSSQSQALTNGMQNMRESFLRLSSMLTSTITAQIDVDATDTTTSVTDLVPASRPQETSKQQEMETTLKASTPAFDFFTNGLQAIGQRVEKSKDNLPRVVVDGYFTTSRERFGCPAFPPEAQVTRTVTVSCFPHEAVRMTASQKHDQISPILPKSKDNNQTATVSDVTRTLQDLLKKAATPAKSEKEHLELFENGRVDGQRWIDEEEVRISSTINISNTTGATDASDQTEDSNSQI